MSGLCKQERDALANIFIKIPNPRMDRSENDRRGQQFSAETGAKQEI